MFCFLVVLFSLSCKLIEAQFTPSVTIDCLAGNNPNDVEVDITSGASTSGKVSLYVGATVCHEINTTTTAFTATFTETDCSGTYPAQETSFYIYVTEGTHVKIGDPDKAYEVTCHTDDSETVTEIVVSTSASVTDHVHLLVDAEVTDVSDVPVQWLTVGTNYKLKIDCRSAYVNHFDIICTTVTANSIVTLLSSGCSNYDFFPTFTHPSQCSLETTFEGFQVTATLVPQVIDFDIEVAVCAGACSTPATCVVEPAWGRKRRDTGSGQTIEILHVRKEFVVYPRNESTETKPKESSTEAEGKLCIPTPVVYMVLFTLCFLIVIGTLVDILLLLAFRRSRYTYLKLDRKTIGHSNDSYSSASSRFQSSTRSSK